MGICYSRSYQCDKCQRTLHKKGPKILYSFRGCGKYHNKLMCDECLSDKLGYDISDLDDGSDEYSEYDIHLPDTKNNDPLGMTIYIKKRLF